MWLTPADQQLFVRGMDEYDSKQGGAEAFAMLQNRYPDSPWSDRLRTVQTLLGTIQEQQKTIKRLKKCQEVSSKQKQRLLQQVASLETDLETMEVERTKLRQLLIDLEQRGR